MGLDKITPKELDALAIELELYMADAGRDFVIAMLELAKNETENWAEAYGLLASNDVEGALLALDYAAVFIQSGNSKIIRGKAIGQAILKAAIRYAILAMIAAA